MVHLLDQPCERSGDGDACGIRSRFPECDGDLVVTLLKLDARHDRLPIGRLETLHGCLVSLEAFASNDLFERGGQTIPVLVLELGGHRPATGPTDFIADSVGDGMPKIRLQGALVT